VALAALAALASSAAGPLVPARVPCGLDATSIVPLALEPGSVAAALAVAPGDAGRGEPAAVAVEVLGPGQDMPSIQVRFAFGSASAPGHRWAWLPGASASLGPGSGPAIARLPGPEPAWMVMLSRGEAGGARPVAVLVRPDEEALRLDLEPLVLGRSLHVFGPLVVPRDDGALLVWGETSGTVDAIRMLPHPAAPGQAPATLAQGLLASRFAATATPEGLAAAWLEEDAASPEGWRLVCGTFDASGQPAEGPVTAATLETPARILALEHGGQGSAVHLLVRRKMLDRPATVTMGPGLSDPQLKVRASPRFSPSTTISAAVTPTGLVLAWRSRTGQVPVLWAWSGRSRWPLAATSDEAVATLAPAGQGAAAAWTAGPRIDVTDISLTDSDGDDVPDPVDQCAGPAEVHDGTLDHDGCPDPPAALASPLEADRVWFPRECDACSWASGAGGVLWLASGARIWIRAGGVEARDPSGTRHVVELEDPAEENGDAEPHGLFALPAGRIAVLTSRGVAMVATDTWTVERWLLAGEDLWAGSWDDERGILVAGTSGRLLRLASVDAPAKTVSPPPGVAKDRPVSVHLDGKTILVAWRDSGVFSRKGWSSAWTPLDQRPQDDPSVEGTARLVRSTTGEAFLVTGGGALLVLASGAWKREEAGLEGVWLRDAFLDPASGRVQVIGIGGACLVLSPHQVDRRIVVASKHLSASGGSVKKSIKAVLGPALALLTSGQRLARIEGHTDAKGGTGTNLALSLKRARAVASWLVDQGAGAGALATIGFGEAHPATKPESTKNRRVEIVLLLP
jgi:hypothetical protein